MTFVKNFFQKDSFFLSVLHCLGFCPSSLFRWLMLKEMEEEVINFRRRNRTSRIVIRFDLNVSLAPSLEDLTGSRIHSNANGASCRWREAVTEWMLFFR